MNTPTEGRVAPASMQGGPAIAADTAPRLQALARIGAHARTLALDVVVVAAALAGVSAILAAMALRTFDAFDMSGFMDAGWRVYSGQQPYVDFYYTGGPVHLYLHALSYILFGFGKAAVLAHLLVVNGIVLVAAYVVARRSLGLAASLLLAVLSSIAFYGPIAHPWYDQNASLWLVLGVLALELEAATPREHALRGGALGMLVTFAFLTKANVGLAGGLVFVVVLAIGPVPRQALAGYAVGAAGAAVVLLGTVSPADYVYQGFIAYRPHTRLLLGQHLIDVLLATPYLLLLGLTAGVASIGGSAFVRAHRVRLALLMGLLLTSVFSAWTGSMKPSANTVLAGIELTLLVVLACRLPGGTPGTAERRVYRTISAGLIACAVVLLVSVSSKTSDRLVWTWRASNLDESYAMTTPAMQGWRCNRRTCEGIDRSVAWIQANVPSNDTLFVFPDATVVYGLAGRESWTPAPFIFHAGQLPAPGPLYQEFRARFTSTPPQWILIHHQTEVGFFHTAGLLRWLELDAFLAARYRVVWQWGDFAMLKLAS